MTISNNTTSIEARTHIQENTPWSLTGLSSQEVAERWAAGLRNDVKLASSRPYGEILQDNVFTFINGVFFVIALVLAGINRFADMVTISLVVLSSSGVNLIQELRAKRQLDQIAILTRPRVRVIRDSHVQEIAPHDIVLGDVLLVGPGDQIVVDGVVVGDGRMDVDESLLTGESDLIAKQVGDEVSSGSFCVSGQVAYEATKIGEDTLAFQLASGARAFRRILTPLQREILLIIQIFLLVATFLWILYGVSYIIEVITLGEVVQVAAVVAGLVPAGLYLAITLAYALGAVRLAGRQAIIQEANAIESLSNVDILCLDKTGTLTSNQINLKSIHPIGVTEEQVREMLGTFAASVSAGNRTNDAIQRACPSPPQKPQSEVPFSSARKWSGLALSDGVYVLGAPEMLDAETLLTPEQLHVVQLAVEQGLRVLLFTHADSELQLHCENDEPRLPEEMTALAILVLSDELRPNVKDTLAEFAEAGVTIKVISGDNPHTVGALARQAGLEFDTEVVSGIALEKMDQAQFDAVARESTIFGRVTPEQKSRLVNSLSDQGHYVAMIGDGVNDVLSLKQAKLSIAMESGSQVTRSVADIILLKDSFEALPFAFLEGQRIRNGVRDVMNLFMVRMLTFVLLIFSVELVTGTFPLLIRHNTVVTTLAVGIPTIGAAFWSKAGQPKRSSLVRSTLHFVLPATLTLTLIGLLVYLGYVATILDDINRPEGVIVQQVIDDFLAVPRSALVTVLVLCGLILVPFLKPPTQAWVGGQPYSGDWRYTYTAIAMLVLFIILIAVEPFRQAADITLLRPRDYLALVTISIGWGVMMRYLWRQQWLDRFLGVDLE